MSVLYRIVNKVCTGVILLLPAFFLNCNHTGQQPTVQGNEQQVGQPKSFKKLPGIHTDTIRLNLPSAVFFYPDSFQREGYREFIPESFESSEHEYLFQINNARNRLKANWKQVEIIDCKEAKYLISADQSDTGKPLNLDELNEPWGLILFEKGKAPAHIDMMNIDTELENYFIIN
ncbi:MAG TPA: hypothetical protein DIW47_02105 [Bacteroidetes bacterium]|nr:hypothetical protein [Bacteroidota bacterium]